MRIALVTDYDSSNVGLESGMGYYIGRALEAEDAHVSRIRLAAPPVLRLRSGLSKARYSLLGKTYIGKRSPARLNSYARQASRIMRATEFDVLLTPNPAPLAHLRSEKPIVLWADTTMRGLIGFYPQHSNLARATIRDSLRADQEFLKRCELAIFASQWAADVAVTAYELDTAKVSVVPFGANLDEVPSTDDVDSMIAARAPDACRLLFLAGDWSRKGGDTAVAVTEQLNRAGLSTELYVVGCLPPVDVPEYVRALGFVSNSNPRGRAQIGEMLANSHFLILPTQAECFGIVFCEASAYGVPSLAYSVGGVPSAVRTGVNGQLFGRGPASEAHFVDYILSCFADYEQYVSLAKSSRREYLERLNWAVAGAKVRQALAGL